MKETQTPRKDVSYRRPKDCPSSKSIFDQSKKNQKVARKSLNSEFASVSEDLLIDSVAESFNMTPMSEVTSDNDHIRESIDSLESLIGVENQSIVTSEEVLTQSESTPCSKITTASNKAVNLSLDNSNTFVSNSSFEVDVVVNLLKQARNQVVWSSDVAATSKKLLDALVESSVRDICALPDEEDRIDWILSKRLQIVVVCFVVWLFTMTLFVFSSGTQSSSSFNPPPT